MDLLWLVSHQVISKVVGRVVIHAQNVERLSINFDVSANRHVGGSQELHVLVYVLVLASFKELAWDDS